MAKWKCYAKPAWRDGKTCGHENDKGIRGPNGLLCCEDCGCTKLASDLRRKETEKHADEVVSEVQGTEGKGE
jgi:hypothetical protein